jgi:adenosylcobinamide kinase / adenosylcobinamide-phosphate guanylyltransferase
MTPDAQTHPRISFVLGGARSGKSLHAETLAHQHAMAHKNLIYVATAQIFDDEMRARVNLHQQRRGPEWTLVEAPMALTEKLQEFDQPDKLILVDCLSIWTTNLLMNEADMRAERETLIGYLAKSVSSLIFVASETGLGIVPDNALARRFRDESGILNQMVACVADEVFFVTAGIATKIK